MQTRKQSAAEAVAHVVIGYLIGLLAQITLFPLVGVQATWSQNLVISVAFTCVSLVRTYVLRRAFNRYFRSTKTPPHASVPNP